MMPNQLKAGERSLSTRLALVAMVFVYLTLTANSALAGDISYRITPLGESVYSYREPLARTIFGAAVSKVLPEYSTIMLERGAKVRVEVRRTPGADLIANVVLKVPGQFLLTRDMLKEFKFYEYALKDLPEVSSDNLPKEFFFPFLIFSEAWTRGVATMVYDHSLSYLKERNVGKLHNVYESSSAQKVSQFSLTSPLADASYILADKNVLLSIQWPEDLSTKSLNVYLWDDKAVRHLPLATVKDHNRYFIKIDRAGCYRAQVISTDYLLKSDVRRFCVIPDSRSHTEPLHSVSTLSSPVVTFNANSAETFFRWKGIDPAQEICQINAQTRRCRVAADFISGKDKPEGIYFINGDAAAGEFRVVDTVDYLGIVKNNPSTVVIIAD